MAAPQRLPDTAPQAPRRLAGQNRLRLVAMGFVFSFMAIGGQLGYLTLWRGADAGLQAAIPVEPRLPRPDIVDRNGRVLAGDLQVASLYADPRKIIDVDEAVELLTATMPSLDAVSLRRKLAQPSRAFVWLKREVSPAERDAVYDLGIPGIGFVNETKRV